MAKSNKNIMINPTISWCEKCYDNFQIFFLKFKGKLLLLNESFRNQTIDCGFKLLFIVKTWQTLFLFLYIFPVIFPKQNKFLNRKILSFLHVLVIDIVSNHKTDLCCLTLITAVKSTHIVHTVTIIMVQYLYDKQ